MLHPEHVSPAILEWDEELRLTRWSQRAETFFGWNMHEMAGHTPHELPFLAAHDAGELMRKLRHVSAGAAARDISLLHVMTRNGEERPCIWFGYPLNDADGRITGIFSLVHETAAHSMHESDITDTDTALGALRGKRLLVVDDGPEADIARQARRLEMDPVTVASLDVAADLIARGIRFDGAIINRSVAGYSAGRLAAMAAGMPDELPVILLTRADAPAPHEEMATLARVLLLEKPVRQPALFAALLTLTGDAAPGNRWNEPRDTTTAARWSPRILIVEDNEINQRVARLMLQRLGYGADIAANGHAALEMLRQRLYEVVLMDLEMPGMGGLETAARIKSELPADRQPSWIIAMTANAGAEHRRQCLAAGMNHYIAKPINKATLAMALQQAMQAIEHATQQNDAADSHSLDLLYQSLGTDDPHVIQDMIGRFVATTTESIISIRHRCAERNTPELVRLAHMLKSSSRMFGAPELADMFEELERTGRAGELERMENLLITIVTEFRQVQRRLQSER